MVRCSEITDAAWEEIAPLLPENGRRGGRGGFGGWGVRSATVAGLEIKNVSLFSPAPVPLVS